MANRGFTLVEILVASTVVMLLTGLGLASWNRFHDRSLLSSVTNQLATELRQVRQAALSGEKPASNCSVFDGYRIEVNTDSLRVQSCCDNCCRAGGSCPPSLPQRTIEIDSRVSLAATNFPLIFVSLKGTTDKTAQLELSFSGQSKTIEITPSGEVKIN